MCLLPYDEHSANSSDGERDSWSYLTSPTARAAHPKSGSRPPAVGSPSGLLREERLGSLSKSERSALRKKALAELNRCGLPTDYILHMIAFLRDPTGLVVPRPFEALTLRYTGRPLPQGGLSAKTLDQPIAETGGQLGDAPPYEHFVCRRGHGAMVFKGRGRQGWIYFCPECGWERMLRASKDVLGLARGVNRRTVRKELWARFLETIQCLGSHPVPWEAIASLLEVEEVVPPEKASDDLTDTLSRLARRHRGFFSPSVAKQIQWEARHWSSPIE